MKPDSAVSADLLAARVDASITTHAEFGDSAAIEKRALARLRVGLVAIGRRYPSLADRAAAWAGADDERMLVLMRDPVLRHGFETDLESIRHKRPVTPMLDATLPSDPSTVDGSPSESLSRPRHLAWPSLGPTWVWSGFEGSDSDPYPRALRRMVEGVFPNPSAEAPITPTDAMLSNASRGASLLVELLPHVGPDVLRHIGQVGFARDSAADGSLLSLSGGDGLPATIFLSPEQIEDPWDAAGTILHEGLHLQLFEVLRCGRLTVDPDAAKNPVVGIPWRKLDWSVMRVLFALHVYVHMVLFDTAVASADPDVVGRYGAPPVDVAVAASTGQAGDFGSALQRASYLGEQLERVVADRLSPYGRRFVAWMVDTLETLAPGVRDGWTHEESPAPASAPAAPLDLPDDTRVRAVEPTAALPLPDQERLVVATDDAHGLRWLNLDSWLIYALCDGRDLASLESAYREAIPSDGADEAARACRLGVAQLADAGLVTVEQR